MKIDKEKVIGYVRAYALMTKDKVIATWKSGRKGKFACIVGAILILLGLKSCLIDGGDSYEDLIGSEYKFSASDFKTKSGGDELFYVVDGRDDGRKEVVPNFFILPKSIAGAVAITKGFQPHSGEGAAFFTDSESDMVIGPCTVIHVGDGWVVAKSDRNARDGNYNGFIYTRPGDIYIEGQKLNAGFYVCVGTHKVQMANGSSQTMFAFVGLDTKSNELAINAMHHNNVVARAAKEENERRAELRREYESFIEHAANFDLRDLKERIHLPKSLEGQENCFRLTTSELSSNYEYDKKITFDELKRRMQARDFDFFWTQRNNQRQPIWDLLSRYKTDYTIKFEIVGLNGAKGWKDDYAICTADFDGWGNYDQHWIKGDAPYEVRLISDIFVVSKHAKELYDNNIHPITSKEKFYKFWNDHSGE